MLTFAENSVELSEAQKTDGQRLRDSSEMSLSELLHPNPAVMNPREFGRLRAEAHKRLSAPLTAVSFALIALVSVLTGTFRRHGGLLRIVVSVLLIVGLLAAQLTLYSLATRAPALLPLIWLQATAPGVIAAWILLVPRRERQRPIAPRMPVAAAVATR